MLQRDVGLRTPEAPRPPRVGDGDGARAQTGWCGGVCAERSGNTWGSRGAWGQLRQAPQTCRGWPCAQPPGRGRGTGAWCSATRPGCPTRHGQRGPRGGRSPSGPGLEDVVRALSWSRSTGRAGGRRQHPGCCVWSRSLRPVQLRSFSSRVRPRGAPGTPPSPRVAARSARPFTGGKRSLQRGREPGSRPRLSVRPPRPPRPSPAPARTAGREPERTSRGLEAVAAAAAHAPAAPALTRGR